MTAEKYLQDIENKEGVSRFPYVFIWNFDSDYVENMLQEYARIKCKEQRELCRDEYCTADRASNIIQLILNAPEPEM